MWLTTLLTVTALQSAPATDPRPRVTSSEEQPAKASFIADGLRFYRKRRFRDARKAFQQAVEADPSDAAAHFYLGYTLYKIGEPTRRMTPEKVEARQEFARCFELDPTFRPTWSWR